MEAVCFCETSEENFTTLCENPTNNCCLNKSHCGNLVHFKVPCCMVL